ncbi:hypothetical protein [Lysobacter capsici]|uniref:hypothetical protein n=1 Tax=Lysobacter capsici TaxID=435897 RepID=UPI001C00449A|nr:hypothetical protein [Lysobacter capsici]QWF16005.1 hypothetical protein KME82_19880 [Lysobacter capsici]
MTMMVWRGDACSMTSMQCTPPHPHSGVAQATIVRIAFAQIQVTRVISHRATESPFMHSSLFAKVKIAA